MTILIAEDTAVDGLLLRNILEHAGYDPVLVTTGMEALAYLEKEREVALVLADVHMPGFSGLDLMRAMQERDELRQIPVIFVTGASDQSTVAEAVALRPAGYILKPVTEPSKVLDRVQRAIARVFPRTAFD